MPVHPLVARLDRWLSRHRPGYYASLNPGATPERLEQLARRAAAPLPPLLRELLSWRDGDDLEAFEYNRSFMPVELILHTMDVMAELVAAGEFRHPDWWRPDWVPFLDGAGGDNVCVDLGGAFGGEPGQIVEFWHADPDRAITFRTLESWLDTRLAAFEAGMFAEDEGENFVPVDEEAHTRFVAARNPGYPVEVTLGC